MGKGLTIFAAIPAESEETTTEAIEPEEIVTLIPILSSTTPKQVIYVDSLMPSSSESPQSAVVVISDSAEESKTEFPAPVTEDLSDDTPMPTETYFKAPKSLEQRTELNVMDGFTTTTPRNADKVSSTVYSTTSPIKVNFDESFSSSSESSAEVSTSPKTMYAVTEDTSEHDNGPPHQVDQSPFLPEGENNATLLNILHAGHDVEPQNETEEIVVTRTEVHESNSASKENEDTSKEHVMSVVIPVVVATTTERITSSGLPTSQEITTIIADASTEVPIESTEVYNLQESRTHNHDKHDEKLSEEAATVIPSTFAADQRKEIDDKLEDVAEGSGDDDKDNVTSVIILAGTSTTTVASSTASSEESSSTASTTTTTESSPISLVSEEIVPITVESVEVTKSEEQSSSSTSDSSEKLVTSSILDESSSVESATEQIRLGSIESDEPVVILTSAEHDEPKSSESVSSTEDQSQAEREHPDLSKLNNDVWDQDERFTKSKEFYNDVYLKRSDNDLKVIPLSKEAKKDNATAETDQQNEEKESNAEETKTETTTGHFLDEATFHLMNKSSFEASKSSEQKPQTLELVNVVKSTVEASTPNSDEHLKSNSEAIPAFSRCTAGQFECLNGTSIKDSTNCINLSERCDSITHCTDNSDEEGCEALGCPDHFQCKDGPCLARQLVCDRIAHCADGSDELPEICGKCSCSCSPQIHD